MKEEIDKALKSKVWLKSGGYIVINQTEALVAIDVNTGKYVGKTARLEDTIVKTNVDAIKEIVRQIRLRDLGGIIVIDFIDMDERRNRQKVMQALEEALRSDRAPSKVLQFNDFGLVAITRKRVKQSLERTIGTPCPVLRSHRLREISDHGLQRNLHRDAQDGEAPGACRRDAAGESGSGKGAEEPTAAKLAERDGRNDEATVIVKSDPALHQEQFTMVAAGAGRSCSGEIGVRFDEDLVELSAAARDLSGPLPDDLVALLLADLDLTPDLRTGDAWVAGAGLNFVHLPVRAEAVGRAGPPPSPT